MDQLLCWRGWGCNFEWGPGAAFPSEAHIAVKWALTWRTQRQGGRWKCPSSLNASCPCSLWLWCCLCLCPPVTLYLNEYPSMHSLFFQRMSFEWLHHLSNNWVIVLLSGILWSSVGDNIHTYTYDDAMPFRVMEVQIKGGWFPVDRVKQGFMDEELVNGALWLVRLWT